jgi:predicted O-linked N-acetylglucosamine transferase (SPINDLY family)
MTEIAEFYFRSNQYQLAKEILIKLISSNEANSKSYEILAYIFGNEGNKNEVYRLLSLACSFPNATAEAHYYFGKELIQNSQTDLGISHLNQALIIGGSFFEVFFELGLAYASKKNFIDAEINFKKGLSLKPDNIESIYNLAKIYSEEFNRLNEGLDLYSQALKLNPTHVLSLIGKASILEKVNEIEDAITLLKKAIEISVDSKNAWLSYGRILTKLGRLDEAISYLDDSGKNFNGPILYFIKGTFFLAKKDFSSALKSFDNALLFDANNAEIWCGKSIAEFSLGYLEKAFSSIENSISQDKESANSWRNRGNFYLDTHNYEMAIQSYERALQLDEKQPLLINFYINAKLKSMSWDGIDDYYHKVKANSDQYLDPLTLLYICDEPKFIFQNNQKYITSLYREIKNLNTRNKQKISKIKIAYVSADFKEHPVTFLLSDIFKYHNREIFEVYGIFINNKEADGITDDVKKLFDFFIDISELSDSEAIELICSYDIDIAFDLMGHTKNAKTNIFLNRIAEIQINFIGYPNTMGSAVYDYIIADSHLISNDDSNSYSEKIIFLPTCFQPNSLRHINSLTHELKVINLPFNTFVYCCFNTNAKISRKMLFLWVQILKETNNSILWIYIEKCATNNFINEINKIDSNIMNRIVFAERTSYYDYLNRFKYAHVFLDTYPFGGGTTTSDALLSGLPVVTLAGSSFHNRMSKSLLLNLHLNELITESFEEYKKTAINLCNNSSAYHSIRRKLETAISDSVIFDPEHYTKDLESALIKITEKII